MSVITTRSGPGFITSVPKSYQAVTLPLMPDPVCYTTTWLDPCTLLLQFRQHYDVELVVTKFNMSLWEAMQLVRGTDVFMGMHGAGFTNLLWLQHVRAVSSNLPAFCASHLSVENHPGLGSDRILRLSHCHVDGGALSVRWRRVACSDAIGWYPP